MELNYSQSIMRSEFPVGNRKKLELSEVPSGDGLTGSSQSDFLGLSLKEDSRVQGIGG